MKIEKTRECAKIHARMKRAALLLTIISLFGISCERHSWEETKSLHQHGGAGDHSSKDGHGGHSATDSHAPADAHGKSDSHGAGDAHGAPNDKREHAGEDSH